MNIASIVYGIVCGWPSPNIPILSSQDTPLPTGPLSHEELSWISSILCIGGLTGTFLFGWIGNHFGRKYPLCFLTVPLCV